MITQLTFTKFQVREFLLSKQIVSVFLVCLISVKENEHLLLLIFFQIFFFTQNSPNLFSQKKSRLLTKTAPSYQILDTKKFKSYIKCELFT